MDRSWQYNYLATKISGLNIVRFLFMDFDEEGGVQKKVDTRDELLVNTPDVIGCIKERQDALRRTAR